MQNSNHSSASSDIAKTIENYERLAMSTRSSKKDQQIYKFCLTGGPCAGKTTAMTHLQNVLTQFGWRVFCVPEAATLFNKGGAMIDMADFTFDMQVKFQILLMQTQINLEDTFEQLAQNEGKKSVLLCDRGLMDGSAYVSLEQWQAVLDEMGWNPINLRDKRYDAVIHMVTAADGAADFYNKSNEARYENVEQAISIDRKLQNAYLGHNKHFIIDNKDTDFNMKIDKCVDVVTKLIGLPTPNSFFKKFLIKIPNPTDHSTIGFPSDEQFDTFEVEETLLTPEFTISVDSETQIEVYLRKRGKNFQYVHTFEIRYTQNNQRIQEQKIITARKYLEFLQQKDPERITLKKKRTCFIYQGQAYQVDTLMNISGNPVFLRAETIAESKIIVPPFIEVIREVTAEPQYTSKHMARKEYVFKAEEDQ